MSTEIIHEKQDLTYLSWSLIRSSSGTAGSFLKATDDLQQPKIYYKLSNYDGINGIVGHECINEIIVDRLLNILEIEHLHYDLIHADIDVDGKEMETYLCASKDFKAHGEHKVALDAYYQAEKLDGETPLQFCTRNGWSDFIYKIPCFQNPVELQPLRAKDGCASVGFLHDMGSRVLGLDVADLTVYALLCRRDSAIAIDVHASPFWLKDNERHF